MAVAGVFYWRADSIGRLSHDGQMTPATDTIDLRQAGKLDELTPLHSAGGLPHRVFSVQGTI